MHFPFCQVWPCVGALVPRSVAMSALQLGRPARSPLVGRLLPRLAHRLLASERRLERRTDERVDSVDEATLLDRKLHRMHIQYEACASSGVAELRRLGLGSLKTWHDGKSAEQRRKTALKYRAVYLGAVRSSHEADWAALNRESLPEVAVFGHANCGKSAFINALSGAPAKTGLASVSTRAGWTSGLGFYRLESLDSEAQRAQAAVEAAGADGAASAGRERGGGIMLVDTPGYGFAVGTPRQMHEASALLADYLAKTRHLSLAVMLLDCTRGLCDADRRVLRTLQRTRAPVLPILTKADLLSPDDLARSRAIIVAQLAGVDASPRGGAAAPLQQPLVVSSHFHAGIRQFWRHVMRLRTTPPA